MQILQVHNEYIFKGGEDTVVENEKKILEENGFTNVKNLGSIEMASKFLNQPIIINNK